LFASNIVALMAYGYVPTQLAPVTWLIWYPAAAAYALGPAFLSEAVSIATGTRAADHHIEPCDSHTSP
jgi:hypothetical protein